ncbi:MAG TPA: hypothetical protein VFA11_02465 [Acidimicrobiales bacterium]|nr:hypothetical protein [Acidimicrobiales bacterium]
MLKRNRGEEGNLIIAIAIIMIIMAAATTFTARAIANNHTTVRVQNFAGALGAADRGLADAMFQLAQGQTSSFCGGAPGCTGGQTVSGLGNVKYEAIFNGNHQWTIYSEGVTPNATGNVPHAIRAGVSLASGAFKYAAFGVNNFTLNGTVTGSDIRNFTEGGTWVSGSVGVGSDDANGGGGLVCNGTTLPVSNSYSGVTSTLTGTESNDPSSTWSSCGGSSTTATSYNPVIALSPPSGSTVLACPSTGVFTGLVEPGIYQCNQDVTVGPLTVDSTSTVNGGVVQLYIDQPASNIVFAGDTNFTSGSLPFSSRFQIYSNVTGAIGNSNGASTAYSMAGIFYAPYATLTANGCKDYYYGALIVGSYNCNGGPNLHLYYDSNLGNMGTSYGVSSYTEIGTNQLPSSSFSGFSW